MTDIVSKEKRSEMMSGIRAKDTKPEKLVRSALHRAGFRFRLHDKRLPGRPDIVLPRYKTVIFVHGCFWHRHPGCKYAATPKTRTEFWQKKFEDNVHRDAEVRAALEADGWRVVVVWECEVDATKAKAIDSFRIDLVIGGRSLTLPVTDEVIMHNLVLTGCLLPMLSIL